MTNNTDTQVRPILRWTGSKRKLLPFLLACVPDNYNRYFEPFVGSACLFLALKPKQAVLNDFNRDLIDTYRIVRKHPIEVAKTIHLMPNTSHYYYKIRDKIATDLTPIKRAARFIYLNRFCFNGIYRVNRLGQFNVPRGTRTGDVPSIKEFCHFADFLKMAKLRSADFEDCLSDVEDGDFIYLDPPYATYSRPSHGEYGYHCFNNGDLGRLINALKNADKKGAIILLSYADKRSLRHALPGWHFRKLTVQRSVAGNPIHRQFVTDLLASNKRLPIFR